jgi:hypothetical protein
MSSLAARLFLEYLDEIEITGTRRDRFYEDLQAYKSGSVDEQYIIRWLESAHQVGLATNIDTARLTLLRQRCDQILLAMLGGIAASAWWSTCNESFDGRTPEDCWTTDPDRVYQYLLEHTDYSW